MAANPHHVECTRLESLIVSVSRKAIEEPAAGLTAEDLQEVHEEDEGENEGNDEDIPV